MGNEVENDLIAKSAIVVSAFNKIYAALPNSINPDKRLGIATALTTALIEALIDLE